MKAIEKDIYIDAPVSEVYSRWSDLTNFPNLMHNVKEVRKVAADTYHWVAEIGGKKVEWDARETKNIPDKEIAWKSISGDQNNGDVRFVPERTGTHLFVKIQYDPPAGILGDLADTITQRMSGDVEEDLKNFRRVVEQARQPRM